MKLSSYLPVIAVLMLISTPSTAQKGSEKAFSQRVSQSKLRENVQSLIGFGARTGGSKSGELSVRFLVKTLKGYGLKTEVVSDGERLVRASASWNLKLIEPAAKKGFFKNEWLANFSPSVSSMKAILLNPKSDHERYGESTPKAFLTNKTITASLYQSYVREGIQCIISYAPDNEGMYEQWAHIADLPEDTANSVPVFSISRTNGRQLQKMLDDRKNVVLQYSTKTKIIKGIPKTIVATLKGQSSDYIIVCAHGDSDSGGPGADDNASGVSGVLELARVLSAMVASKTIPPPQKTIKFIIWGMEYHSAEQYVKKNASDLASIRGVYNFDEIGYGATRNCIYFESNDIGHNAEFIGRLDSIGREFVGKRGFWHEATTTPSQYGTDSYVFLPDYLARLGIAKVKIPTTTIYSSAWNSLRKLKQTPGWTSTAWKGPQDSVFIDFSPYYHSPLDIPSVTTEKEPFNMEWGVKAVGIALLRSAWQK